MANMPDININPIKIFSLILKLKRAKIAGIDKEIEKKE